MSFSKWEGKKEIRFGENRANRKFLPDPGRYEVEVQDSIDTSYNERSGVTSLVVDFKTLGYAGQHGDGSDIGLNLRVWFADGIQVAKDKLSAVIYSAGVAKQFDELFEEVPNMDNERWPEFLREVRARLAFRKLGVEVAHRKGDKNTFADIVSFFPLEEKRKVIVETDDSFKWPEQ